MKESFEEQISNAQNRLEDLIKRSGDLKKDALLSEMLEELSINLHELQVAAEELHSQNEELLSSRQDVEAERRRYQELFEFAPDGYFVTDARGTISEANQAAVALLKVSAEFLAGKPLLVFIAEEEHRLFLEKLSQLQEKEKLNWEMRMTPRNGDAFFAELTVAGVRNREGKLAALRWLVKDITERKQAEEINMFQANILSQVNDAVIALDNDNRIIYCNNGAERLYNLRSKEMLGMSLGDSYKYLMPNPEVEKDAHDSLAERGIWRSDSIPVKRGGEEIYVDVSVSLLRNKSEAKIGTLALVRDVTERRQIEEALRESEQKYRNIFDNAGDAIINIDLDSRVTSWNLSAERIFGWKGDEVIGKKLDELIIPGDRKAEFKRIVQEAVSGEIIIGAPLVRQRKDGSRVDVSLTISSMTNTEGKIIGLSGIFRDITERKRMEEALKESEEKYRGLFDSAGDAVITIDLEDRITSWNKSAERIFGWTAEEAVGKKPPDLTIPEDKIAERESIIRDALDGKNITGVETTRLRKDGSKINVSLTFSPIKNAEGKITGLSGILRDITERREAEDERARLLKDIQNKQKIAENLAMLLREERDTLKIIMENIANQVAYLDSNFEIIRVNSAYAKGSGYSKEELIGRNHFELFPDPENQAIFKEVRDTGKAVEFKAKPFEYADQPWRGITYWDWTLTPLKNASGSVEHLVLSLMDVTELVQRGEAIQEALKYAETIIDTIPEPIVILDAQLRVKTANYPFYKTFKVSIEDTLDKFFYDLGNRQWDIPELRKLLEEIVPKHGYIHGFEVEHEFPSIGRKTMLLNSRIINQDGKEMMILLTIADITERQKIDAILLENERLVSAGRARNEFLTIMSHELRTPLTSVIGYSILLKEKGELNEKQEFYVENLLASSRHLLDLINSILDLAKMEAGKLEMVIEDISMPDVINETLDLMKEKAVRHNIVLKKEIDAELQLIKADRQKFKQILFNLLSNAIKFSKEEGGTVTISVKKEDDMAKISISDTGIGISEEDIPRLFQKFVQLDSGISRKYGGTGLGLAITKQIVEMHGGKIMAESRHGEGSTFTFLLPIGGREN